MSDITPIERTAEQACTAARLSRRGICVIIPTYNNGATIAAVAGAAMQQCNDVFVVCDGCTDDTLQQLESMPHRPSLVVLEKNSGKGAALKAGFREALSRGFAYAITLDGDGQHYPEDIPVLLQANIDNPGALIVGRRMNLKDAERSKGSKFANKFSNFWFAVQTGHHLEDTQTGYRLYPLKKLHGLGLLTSRYEAELELLVFASWNGVRIETVSVNVYYPPREQRVSHFRPGADFTRIFVLNTVLCILAVVYGYPRMALRGLSTFVRLSRCLVMYLSGIYLYTVPGALLVMPGSSSEEKKRCRIHRLLWKISYFITVKHGIPGSKFSVNNPQGEDLSDPAVLICNHQSAMDLMPLLSFSPKIVVLTADWVWNSPYFGYPIRKAGYMQASKGLEELMPQIRKMVAEGYSVAVFPEGTRSDDGRIGRFHQGAFHIAAELGLDIIPFTLYGSGRVMHKHEHKLNKWPMHLEVGRRLSPAEMLELGPTCRSQASAMRKIYNDNYSRIADEMEKNV